ncbi:AAA family ATPase [Ketobacter sp.]|uniref:AAA family ATPase n=1 Tax=Ketobacter sp. TaxID=2083498 RepID=UPI000F106CCB|nr:AAA family ATPase [Ketobacter sp.]RLT92129.1 MAG: shikimate kinase [Ketobacter sp.]
MNSKNILIFGNSGSGKSTLAQKLCAQYDLAHLDLDVIAWKPGLPPARMPLAESGALIERFVAEHAGWVIEGCYADLLEMLLGRCNELIFLDLPVAMCIENARKRPWEPHKYESKAAQDANLEMLIQWIAQYPERSDTFSRAAHRALFERFDGNKTLLELNHPT